MMSQENNRTIYLKNFTYGLTSFGVNQSLKAELQIREILARARLKR